MTYHTNAGDLLVRPSWAEFSIRRTPGGSVRDHYLTRYKQAFTSVIQIQESGKYQSLMQCSLDALNEDTATRMAMQQQGLIAKRSSDEAFDDEEEGNIVTAAGVDAEHGV